MLARCEINIVEHRDDAQRDVKDETLAVDSFLVLTILLGFLWALVLGGEYFNCYVTKFLIYFFNFLPKFNTKVFIALKFKSNVETPR